MSNYTIDEKVFLGNFDEVKKQIHSQLLQQLDFELEDLGSIRTPDLSLEDSFKLYAELRGEVDRSKTLFLKNSDELFDLSRAGDERLSEYEFREIIKSYLEENPTVETESLFVFDDELIVDDDNQTINGYLWAMDALVDRLPVSDEKFNINFYADYDVVSGNITVCSTYLMDENGTKGQKIVPVPLEDSEKAVLVDAMEAYCQATHSMSCLELVNDIRTSNGLNAISINKSQTLEDKISSADHIKAHKQTEKFIDAPIKPSR